MFDGVKIEFEIFDYLKWKQLTGTGKRLDTEYNETNGFRKERTRGNTNTISHRGTWKRYRIEVKEVITSNRPTRYYLHIHGSFHKNYFDGKNYLPFTYSDFIKELNNIESGLQLMPNIAKLKNLEFGVNIKTVFSPFKFLKDNLLLHKVQPFLQYESGENGKTLGMHCTRDEFEVKIYDKGLQYDLPYNLMRFELRITTMRWFKKYGIKCLADLHEFSKANLLLQPLLEAWDSLLFTDMDIDKATLNIKERELFLSGSRAGYWPNLKERVNPKTYHKKLTLFKKIISTHGRNYQLSIRPQIIVEWEQLCNGYGTDSLNGQTIWYGIDSLNGQTVQKEGGMVRIHH